MDEPEIIEPLEPEIIESEILESKQINENNGTEENETNSNQPNKLENGSTKIESAEPEIKREIEKPKTDLTWLWVLTGLVLTAMVFILIKINQKNNG